MYGNFEVVTANIRFVKIGQRNWDDYWRKEEVEEEFIQEKEYYDESKDKRRVKEWKCQRKNLGVIFN